MNLFRFTDRSWPTKNKKYNKLYMVMYLKLLLFIGMMKSQIYSHDILFKIQNVTKCAVKIMAKKYRLLSILGIVNLRNF